MERAEAQAEWSIQVIREADLLWRLEGEHNLVLTGLYASTENLTAGQVELLPGQKSDVQFHAGDESVYLLKGTLNIRLPDQAGQRWFELRPRDGFYIPRGVGHQYYNVGSEPARYLFGVAPQYRGEPAPAALSQSDG